MNQDPRDFQQNARVALNDPLLRPALGRLKTGTPARLDGRTIDYTRLEPQFGDENPEPFSSMTERLPNRQVCCHITETTAAGHAIVRENAHLTAVYSGAIAGRGMQGSGSKYSTRRGAE